MSGRQQLAATARRLKRDHGDLLRPPVSFRRPDLDRAFDEVARRRAERSSGGAPGQLVLDLRQVSTGRSCVLAADAWVCERHPDSEWPHDDCPGPGMLRTDAERC